MKEHRDITVRTDPVAEAAAAGRRTRLYVEWMEKAGLERDFSGNELQTLRDALYDFETWLRHCGFVYD